MLLQDFRLQDHPPGSLSPRGQEVTQPEQNGFQPVTATDGKALHLPVQSQGGAARLKSKGKQQGS